MAYLCYTMSECLGRLPWRHLKSMNIDGEWGAEGDWNELESSLLMGLQLWLTLRGDLGLAVG